MKNAKAKRVTVYGKIRLAVFISWVALAMFCFGVTPLAFHYSYAFRGYRAIGGEALIPLIPFIFMPQFMNLSDALCYAAKKMRTKRRAAHSCAFGVGMSELKASREL